MSKAEIRWIQRFNQYQKALSQLREAVDRARERPLTELERQGLIQAFECTHELAWRVMKDFLESRGVGSLYGSRDTTREAFRAELIAEGEVWMRMIDSRNLSSHTYNEAVAEQIAGEVLSAYIVQFEALREKMEQLKA